MDPSGPRRPAASRACRTSAVRLSGKAAEGKLCRTTVFVFVLIVFTLA